MFVDCTIPQRSGSADPVEPSGWSGVDVMANFAGGVGTG